MGIRRRDMASAAIVAAAATAVVAASVPARAQPKTSDSTWELIKKNGAVRMGVFEFPPYFVRNKQSGEWEGAMVEMGKDIANELKTKYQPVEVGGFAESVLSLQAGKVDMNFALQATPIRATAIDFAGPIYWIEWVTVNSKNFKGKDWTDYNKEGVKVAVMTGTSDELLLRKMAPKATRVEFKLIADLLAEGDEAMIVQFLDRARHAVLFQIIGRGVAQIADAHQMALDEVGLAWRGQTDGHVGFAHGEIEIVIDKQKRHVDLGIEIHELLDARRKPHRTEADGRCDLERAFGTFLGIGETGLGHRQFVEDLVRGQIQIFALLGQQQSARMAMEQSDAQALFERTDLAADRRLAQVQCLACVREAAGFGDGMENAQLVPIHARGIVGPISAAGRTRRRLPAVTCTFGGDIHVRCPKLLSLSRLRVTRRSSTLYSAATRSPVSRAARYFSVSSAAMQPVPAAVTAWRNFGSCTSPAANTPSMSVLVESGFVIR